MSLLGIVAITAAVAASLGYLARRRGEPRSINRSDADPTDEDPGPAPAKRSVKPARPERSPFADLPLALGDVVMAGSDERWLAGAIVARENDRVVGALFLAPEGTEVKAVAVFAPPRKDICWMSPVDLATPDEPSATVELGGILLDRKGRLPVTLERMGQGAPPVGEEGLWAVYERGRDVAVVVVSEHRAHAWLGRRLDADEYDRLGGGD